MAESRSAWLTAQLEVLARQLPGLQAYVLAGLGVAGLVARSVVLIRHEELFP
jgi:hypothetical protein